MTNMIPEGDFGHGVFSPKPLTQEEIRTFACLVRKRYETRTCQPVAWHVRLHDMLAVAVASLRDGLNVTLDYCVFWALRENQGLPYYKRTRQQFMQWMQEAFAEFKLWQAAREQVAVAA